MRKSFLNLCLLNSSWFKILLIPVVQQSDSVIDNTYIYIYTLSLKKDIKWQFILKITDLFKRILNDTSFLKLFLKFSLCRVSLTVGLSHLPWVAFSLQCLSCSTLQALDLYLGLELLCALRSRSPPSRSVQETLSLSPWGPRREVRRGDLGLQLIWDRFWPVPSAQGGREPWAPTRDRAGPPRSTPGRVPSGSWDPNPQRGLQVLWLLHSLSLLVVRLQRPTVPVCHRWGTSSWPMLCCSCSVAMSSPIICDPMDCSMTDSSVLHYLLIVDYSLVVVQGPSYLREAMSQSCRATQDRWVIVKSPGKTWSPGGGNGSPLHHSCLENPWRVPCFTL